MRRLLVCSPISEAGATASETRRALFRAKYYPSRDEIRVEDDPSRELSESSAGRGGSGRRVILCTAQTGDHIDCIDCNGQLARRAVRAARVLVHHLGSRTLP
jgi:hypothetical protein